MWDNEYSLLHWCSKRGYKDLCLYLLEYHADPRTADGKGKNAIEYAQEAGHLELVASYESSHYRPDTSMLPPDNLIYLSQVESHGWNSVEWDRGYSLLHWCAKRGLKELCHYLVQLNADPRKNDEKGLSAADYARNNGHSDLAQLLDPNSRTEAAIPVDAKEDPENAMILAEKHGWHELRWAQGFTLLHWAACSQSPIAFVVSCLEMHADLYARDTRGYTAIDYARSHDAEEITALLEERMTRMPSLGGVVTSSVGG